DQLQHDDTTPPSPSKESTSRFYSPLVKNIAAEEGITSEELDSIPGTGNDRRVTKQDVLDYLARKNTPGEPAAVVVPQPPPQNMADSVPEPRVSEPLAETSVAIPIAPQDEIIEMDRMRRLIADHMV